MTIPPRAVRQAAVLAVQGGRVCLVTSSNGRRWVLPKGCIEEGQTAAEAARQEAWEEAGLVGRLSPRPLGNYVYHKAGRSHHVVIFWMEVDQTAEDWPEAYRQRRWFSPAGALARIDEVDLQELLREVLVARGEIKAAPAHG